MCCKIIKDKTDGKEYLIPDCYGVVNTFGSGIEMSDRDIIKTYCYCDRPDKKVYEDHTKGEVIDLLEKLEQKIEKHKDELVKMVNELDCLKSEIFMLNTIEVI